MKVLLRRCLMLTTLAVVSLCGSAAQAAEAQTVTVFKDAQGFKLQVDGQDMMVLGMNWGYMPIGENYTYDFWGKSDAFIKDALKSEMTLLREMGVNTIRQSVGIPPRWITYIYKKYGIYTVLNHPVGRYGHLIDGVWLNPINYEDKRVREVLKAEVSALVERYKNTPGLLMWMLGNENNYGLAWKTAAVADLPTGEANKVRAVFLYSLMGEIIRDIKAKDSKHPVSLANGDLGYIDLIAEHCKGLDVMAANVYRGKSARDLFAVVKKKLDLPFMFSEFGSDAYNAKEKREDAALQAKYLRAQWQEIYEQSHGKGRVGNAIGGMTFQWSDGWWKHGQTEKLDQHDTTASWANGGYPEDLPKGGNNMNEEWFGICAKRRSNERGLYRVVPRTAYYVLKAGYRLQPYDQEATLQNIRAHWRGIDIEALDKMYLATSLAARVEAAERFKVTDLRMNLSTFTTGGRGLTDEARMLNRTDHMESFFVGFQAKPVDSVRLRLSFNVLGNVADNPINEIFYERRGKPVSVLGKQHQVQTLQGVERFKVYAGEFEWEERYFKMKGLYRVGHYHWGNEGDFFGLYRQAYYGANIDLYDAAVPSGFEVIGKRAFKGLKLAFGPQIYWGANPTVIAKYQSKVPGTDVEFALMHQEDITQRTNAAVSTVIPQPVSRRTSLYLKSNVGPVKVEVGGLMAGSTLLGRPFERAEPANGRPSYLNSGYLISDDKIQLVDTLGGKVKLTLQKGGLNWFAQAAYKGVAADAGPDEPLTFTGWTLKESGLGNQFHVRTGTSYRVGYLEIAPNFIYQKPLVGPLPRIGDAFDPVSGRYFPGVEPRNILQDPFIVRGNQEMLGYELMLVFDPTPATFIWDWDNEKRENAPLAAILNLVYRDYRQSQDANIGVLADGTLFSFDSSPPPVGLWEARLKLLSNPWAGLRMILQVYAGTGQSRGSDTRVVQRFGGDFRATWERWAFRTFLRFNDWGPYDFHRDFNLTFPFQWLTDVSFGAVPARWLGNLYTRVGVRAQLRTLDQYSPRYDASTGDAAEWEVMTYCNVSL